MPLNPIYTKFLQRYPFSGKRISTGYTDEEFRNTFGEEKYNDMIIQRIRQRLKWGQDLPSHEKAFIQEHPELSSELQGLK
jgi:hypothetical protein